jgi:hypothetical protein
MNNIELYKSSFRIKEPDYIDQVVITFLSVFPDYEILNRGKEREAAGRLAKIYRQKYPKAKTEDALAAFVIYFNACKNIDDQWMIRNMSLPLIMSKFSIINRLIRMKRLSKNVICDKYLKPKEDDQQRNIPSLRP